ncbi:hypothetical protein [Streptomyces sp. NPDC055681]
MPGEPDTASPATGPEPCRPARPIALLLHTRYLATQPIDTPGSAVELLGRA